MKTVRSPDRVAPGNPHSRTGREIPGCGGWASNPAPARVARKRRQPPAALAPQAPAPAAPKKLAPGSAGEVKLYDTDPRDAAMIMSIVADKLGKPLNELRFKSIKEVK